MPRKKPNTTAIVLAPAEVERRIHVVRGVRVMLDSELAELYGIATKVLNQAVERNADRFPTDFAFLLTNHEVTDLRSPFVTSKVGRGGRRYQTRAFTEEGIAMLSSVLRSKTAVRVNIEIMRGFVRLRRLLATPGELVTQLQLLAETVQLHDSQIKTIADALTKMLEPPPDNTPKRRIGFIDTNTHSEDKQ